MAKLLVSVTARRATKTTRITMQRKCTIDSANLDNWIARTSERWKDRGYTVDIRTGVSDEPQNN